MKGRTHWIFRTLLRKLYILAAIMALGAIAATTYAADAPVRSTMNKEWVTKQNPAAKRQVGQANKKAAHQLLKEKKHIKNANHNKIRSERSYFPARDPSN